jgi:hypothetical protein
VNCHDGELVDRFLQGDRAAANRIKNDAKANKQFLIHSTVLLPSDLKKFVGEKYFKEVQSVKEKKLFVVFAVFFWLIASCSPTVLYTDSRTGRAETVVIPAGFPPEWMNQVPLRYRHHPWEYCGSCHFRDNNLALYAVYSRSIWPWQASQADRVRADITERVLQRGFVRRPHSPL